MKYKNSMIGTIFYNLKRSQGMALIEVTVAVALFSTVILSIYSPFIAGINFISDSKNHTKAIILAKSLMNDFRNNNMRDADISDAPIDNYPGFTYDRETMRFDDGFITPMIEPLVINKATIKVKWKYNDKERSSELTMIYQAK